MNPNVWNATLHPATRKKVISHPEQSDHPVKAFTLASRHVPCMNVRDAQAFSVKSHIVKHWMAKYPSLPTPPKMDFSITAKFKDCLSRQIGEVLHISFSRDTLLNSKAEYLSNSVSRLTVKEDAWVLKERQRVEDETKQEES